MKIVRAALAAVLGAVLLAPAALPASAATCSTPWGSGAKSSVTDLGGRVTDVRAGRQACFDRLVVDIDGKLDSYSVQYVDQVRKTSYDVVPLRGGAKLQVTAFAPSYDAATGRETYSPANGRELVSTSGYRTFRQVAFVESWEGTTDLGLGVRAKLPFRAYVIDGPGTGSRLVVDVAHSW